MPLSLAVVSPGQPPALSPCLSPSHLPPRFTWLPCPSIPLSPRGWEHPRPPTLCSGEPSAPRGKSRETAAEQDPGCRGSQCSAPSQCSGQGRSAGRTPRCIRSPALGSDRSPKPRALCGICLTWKQPPTLALLARQWP